MGALVNADVNGGKIKDAMDGPLVYQLVRVEGDGRLVPATDDEVIEVEHLLENDKNEMSSVDIPCHLEECVSSEVISSKKSDLESSEGISQSGSDEINSRKFNARLENIVGRENENMLVEAPNTQEQDLKHRKMTTFGEISHEGADAGPTLKGVPRRKHHRAWTLAEVTKLVEGVSKYGTGRWSEIKRIAFASHTYRTSVDLKDKWRNLLKASCAQVPTENGVRKHGSMPVPRAILYRVRELAKIHSQAGVEFGPSKCATSAGRAIQEKVAGYL